MKHVTSDVCSPGTKRACQLGNTYLLAPADFLLIDATAMYPSRPGATFLSADRVGCVQTVNVQVHLHGLHW